MRITVPLVCTVLTLAGCGGTAGPGPAAPGQSITITAQPTSQTIPIGDTATFSVTATSEGPLNYQWSENGAAIPGATASSYTTSPVALAADGSTTVGTFQVTVSNATGSIVSDTATLWAGARAPKPGDLRYLLSQQISAPGLFSGDVNAGTTAYSAGNSIEDKVSPAIGTPLGLGSNAACADGTCAWAAIASQLPKPLTGFAMYYYSSLYSTFATDVRQFIMPNTVITSLDFEPGPNYYALSAVQTSQPGGFDYRMEVVPPSQVQANAVADGQASRIITALTFDAAGNANMISYGWTGDTTTVYEAQTTSVPPGPNVCEAAVAAATALASQGYFISAFGGNDTNGYVLVGMRVKGDSLPRPVEWETKTNRMPASFSLNPPYFTTVLYLREIGDLAGVNEQ
ncbi:MAG: hypothetical protein RB191_00755 [Terriglobia bacterium]|nr:hypothetical protein [Terriglobia bacterium]